MSVSIVVALLVAALFARVIWRRFSSPARRRDRRLLLFFSVEDTMSQVLLLLAVFFLGIALLAFNREGGDPLSWRTILLLTSLAALAVAYSLKAAAPLGVGLVGAATWWGTQAAHWMNGTDMRSSAMMAGIVLIGLLYCVLGWMHGDNPKWKRFGTVYLLIGIFSVTALLFFFSTKTGLEALEKLTMGSAAFASWQVVLSLCLLGISLLVLIIAAMATRSILSGEAAAAVLIALLFVEIALLPQQNFFVNPRRSPLFFMSAGDLTAAGIAWAVAFNVIVFLELLGIVFSGYARREEWLINLGAAFIFLLALVKYCDWFFTSLDKSIFFIGAGILLFAVGWIMERGRRRVISGITRAAPGASQPHENGTTN